MGTVLGAAAGVGGAIGAATVAARNQLQRTKQEQEYDRQQQAQLDERQRMDAVASTASASFEKVVIAAALNQAAWQQPDGTAARQAAQLAVAQAYAASELFGEAETLRLVAGYAKPANDAMAATARSRANEQLAACAERYGSLMQYLGRRLQLAR
ncbi:hypothetical protein [Micromonospora tarensis]|uniref:Uncharacterized protein n=1 Tax=Micromonospora tarensis TaxID=2806100 RepID=A0ABS1YJU0_9ACTN|nr:hypothetical protein [Micromonospora tarensis]MBM0277573.1 hypothetical protein [Micromonospora tarensis]